MTPHKTVTYRLYRQYAGQSKPTEIHKFTTVVFENEDEIQKGIEYLRKRHNWEQGLHYEEIKFEIKEIIKNNNMAKTVKATEVKEETTAVVVFEKQAESISLPEIPKVMTIGGIEFSEELIKKEVDAVKKIVITEPKDTDTAPIIAERKKVYEELKEKKNKFVKTRTAPEKFRADIVKPINNWSKSLKAQTDAFGSLAKEGEEHCLAQMAVLENWEAEQERLEREATEIRVKERSQQLSDLGATKNFDSGHWVLPYALHVTIEPEKLESEFGWDEVIEEVTKHFNNHQTERKAEAEKNKNILESLFNARVMLLDMMKYERSGDSFSKNGYTLSKEDIQSLTDADFQSKLQEHNTPKQSGGFGGGFGGSFAKTHKYTGISQEKPANAFAQFAQTPTDSHAEPIKEEDTYEYLATTEWTVPFVEKEMPQTIIRVAPVANREEVMQGTEGKQILYNEELGLGLFYIIFKK